MNQLKTKWQNCSRRFDRVQLELKKVHQYGVAWFNFLFLFLFNISKDSKCIKRHQQKVYTQCIKMKQLCFCYLFTKIYSSHESQQNKLAEGKVPKPKIHKEQHYSFQTKNWALYTFKSSLPLSLFLYKHQINYKEQSPKPYYLYH